MKGLYLIDTHCHLWHPEYHFDLRRIIQDARDSQIKYLINVGVNIETSQEAIRIARKYKPVYATVGYHPHYAKDFRKEDKFRIKELIKQKKVVAIGEIGLDFYRKISSSKSQFMVLSLLLEIWQEQRDLPLIIHNREAYKEILGVLDEIEALKPKVVMHCFQGDRDFLEKCLKRGYFISFATNLTFNKKLQELIKYTPLERLLLETDSPYLAPVKRKNYRNKPSCLRESIPIVAGEKEVEEEDVIRSQILNTKIVFGIGNGRDFSSIVYKYKGNLYINITNRCTNQCRFCISRTNDYFSGYNLRLKKEPGVKEVLKEVKRYRDQREVTFCGFGEPFIRFKELKEIAAVLKNRGYSIRIVTNGHGNLIAGENILPQLRGLIDKISVSLNVEDEAKYLRYCKPKFGEQTFKKVIEFIQLAKEHIPWIEITFLALPGIEIEKCKEIASVLGVNYRIRNYNLVI